MLISDKFSSQILGRSNELICSHAMSASSLMPQKARDLARKSLGHILEERHTMEYRVLPTQQENLALEALAGTCYAGHARY
jgi:hypothetical protein